MIDLSHAVWRKSRRSGSGNNCVELAGLPGVVAVRDSKNPDNGALTFTPGEMRNLIGGIKAGKHHL